MLHWTGHPFVDAGLAALAAAVDADRLEDFNPDDLQDAAEELKRLLLSDQALGLSGERAFVKGPLSQLFPNSELVNPSNWKGQNSVEKANSVRQKFQDALRADTKRARDALQGIGEELCFVCGEARPLQTMITVRKDKMPLLEGIVNFYPAFAYGVRICGVCAFAVRFLPMSVMRAGASNRLWFLHTQSLPIAAAIAKRYGWRHFNDGIARNEALDFFGDWQTAGDAATVLFLLCELLEEFREHLWQFYERPVPTTAYLFSNDNRGGYVQALPIPNELLIFFAQLQIESQSAFRRFWKELLEVPKNLKPDESKVRIKFVQSVASRMLQSDDIIEICLDREAMKLRGGWLGHRLYLREVRRMSVAKLSILERLGIAIAQSDDARQRINELRNAQPNELYALLLRYVREGWLKHDEFYTVLPPNDYRSSSQIRDILLAVIYEWQRCQETGEEFPVLEEKAELSPDETLQRLQQIGDQLVTGLPNPSRWIGQLQTARSSDVIRGTYLNAVRNGAMRFNDFVFLAPLSDRQRLWLLRDYLLAFLFDRMREALPEEEEIALSAEILTEDKIFNGGEE
ncbi:MAG: type I-B CRISPR-associated protein Cas8b1/Cst1 [Armatimonadetes bacterium]|nr:type I-B CRISPR-associated protein Cas8b1/Cst1 [Armatimonadota bacterium]MDW8121940.1 Cas8a1 family CRISPR/Cas system-associated protein [Armatimonadota bacterium]